LRRLGRLRQSRKHFLSFSQLGDGLRDFTPAPLSRFMFRRSSHGPYGEIGGIGDPVCPGIVDFPAVQAVNRREQDSLDLLRSYFYFVANAGPLFLSRTV